MAASMANKTISRKKVFIIKMNTRVTCFDVRVFVLLCPCYDLSLLSYNLYYKICSKEILPPEGLCLKICFLSESGFASISHYLGSGLSKRYNKKDCLYENLLLTSFIRLKRGGFFLILVKTLYLNYNSTSDPLPLRAN